MTGDQITKDLVVLVADKNMEFSVKGLLARYQSLRLRQLSLNIHVHPESDPGCFLRGHTFLRPFYRQYSHALVLLDRHGCGKEDMPRKTLERDLEERLSRAGWGNRAAVVVIDPELEVWVWSDSPEVGSVLGWVGRKPSLAEWLRSQGYQRANQCKPNRPKEAVEKTLKITRKPRSSAMYRELAERVSVNRCVDPAFVKFKTTLQGWFGQVSP